VVDRIEIFKQVLSDSSAPRDERTEALKFLVHFLEKLIADEHLTASGNPEDWANESHSLAQRAWLSSGAQIDENYYREQIKVVDKRLALAGLRLAAVLNEAFAQVH
jgi:hypothetical protein